MKSAVASCKPQGDIGFQALTLTPTSHGSGHLHSPHTPLYECLQLSAQTWGLFWPSSFPPPALIQIIPTLPPRIRLSLGGLLSWVCGPDEPGYPERRRASPRASPSPFAEDDNIPSASAIQPRQLLSTSVFPSGKISSKDSTKPSGLSPPLIPRPPEPPRCQQPAKTKHQTPCWDCMPFSPLSKTDRTRVSRSWVSRELPEPGSLTPGPQPPSGGAFQGGQASDPSGSADGRSQGAVWKEWKSPGWVQYSPKRESTYPC